jgi:hypothetical protein
MSAQVHLSTDLVFFFKLDRWTLEFKKEKKKEEGKWTLQISHRFIAQT